MEFFSLNLSRSETAAQHLIFFSPYWSKLIVWHDFGGELPDESFPVSRETRKWYPFLFEQVGIFTQIFWRGHGGKSHKVRLWTRVKLETSYAVSKRQQAADEDYRDSSLVCSPH